MRFFSDNTASVSPEILAALSEANVGREKAYGDDQWTQQLDAAFSRVFEKEVRAFIVATGTAANSLSLATLSPPYGSIYVHDKAHVVHDECGATEFFTNGARLVLVPGQGAKMTVEALRSALNANPASVHTVQPVAISLTQATELGTVYQPAEITGLAQLAHERNLKVHMDGARFANALATLNCKPADVTWRAGVDVLSFGATKNGALTAEAVVFFDTSLVRDFEFRRKRGGQLLSKSRYTAVQLLAYLRNDLWLRNARRANSLAARVGAAAGSRLLHPVEANEIFVKLGDAGKERLRAQGFEFYDWGALGSGEARFVVSWDQPDDEVTQLCHALSA